MKETLSTNQRNTMPIIRIAPVCNGKIYVIHHTSEERENPKIDIPIEEYVHQAPTQSGKMAKKIKGKYRLHLQTDMPPRFSVKYKSPSDKQEIVYLYILPLKEENEIKFQGGKFITTDDIHHNSRLFSPNLQFESELLCMAAELWNDYFQTLT